MKKTNKVRVCADCSRRFLAIREIKDRDFPSNELRCEKCGKITITDEYVLRGIRSGRAGKRRTKKKHGRPSKYHKLTIQEYCSLLVRITSLESYIKIGELMEPGFWRQDEKVYRVKP